MLAGLLGESGRYAESVELWREASKLDPEGGDHAYEIFETTTMGTRNDAFSLDQSAAAAKAALASEDVSPGNKAMVYLMSNWLAGKKDAPDYALPFLEPALKAVQAADDSSLTGMENTLAVEYALKIEKDPAHAARLRYEAMPPGWQEDPQQLNRYAWWCFEHGAVSYTHLTLPTKRIV